MAHPNTTNVVTYETQGPHQPSPRISLCAQCEEIYRRDGNLALTTVHHGVHRGWCYYSPAAIERRSDEAELFADVRDLACHAHTCKREDQP